jgi:glycosyltransferase involved in cell wall biosynthesis
MDRTQSALDQLSRNYANLRTFSQLKRGAAATRNVGIRAAKAGVVLFIDDDILAEPNLIEAHLQYHQTHPRASIIGSVTTLWDDRSDPFLRYLGGLGICNPYGIARGPVDFSYYHTGNVSTSRALLEEAGCFNEEFFIYGMEDIELGYRLEKLGCRMVHGSEAKAVHVYVPTYEQFIQRCEQAGFSLGKLIELHPELRKRFIENGKRTRWLKRFHHLYRAFSTAVSPLFRLLTKWEKNRGTGRVLSLLEVHYYWAIRYHFFVGYNEYVRHAVPGGHTDMALTLGGQRIPKLAMERRKLM